MKCVSVASLAIILLAGGVLFQGCDENPIDTPDVGSGTLLKATIEGQSYTFSINTDDTGYDEVVFVGTVSGSTDELPVQSIKITFNYDIDGSTFPVTLNPPDAVITVGYDDGSGTTKAYQSIAGNDARVILTASNSQIVDGTFSGTLENTKDATDKITVSGGEFSARLPRN